LRSAPSDCCRSVYSAKLEGAPAEEFGPATLAASLDRLAADWRRASLVLAVSGGMDSSALLSAAAALRRQDATLSVRALHVNHGLTPAAGALERAARALCASLGIELTTLTIAVPVPHFQGLEAAARAARYRALGASLAAGELLLTAHHLEDQGETLLLQLLRGAGVAGAAAMPARAALGEAWLLRPLLGVERRALATYARDAGLAWQEDPMNAQTAFDRVYLRERLWPAITARWPAAARTLSRAAGHFASAQRLLEAQGAADLATLLQGPTLAVEPLKRLSSERRANALRLWLAELQLPLPSSARLAALEAVLAAGNDRNPCLRWPGAQLHRYRGALYAFAPLPDWPGGGAVAVPLAQGTPASLGALGTVHLVGAAPVGTRPLDPECLPLELKVRAGGERLRLHAGGPHRTVKELLRERGVPPWLRARLPFLHSGGRCVGVMTPRGAWLDASVQRAAGGGPGLVWRDAPAAFAAFEAAAPFL
jgi:tRNA(Ile)-lysidine synthase